MRAECGGEGGRGLLDADDVGVGVRVLEDGERALVLLRVQGADDLLLEALPLAGGLHGVDNVQERRVEYGEAEGLQRDRDRLLGVGDGGILLLLDRHHQPARRARGRTLLPLDGHRRLEHEAHPRPPPRGRLHHVLGVARDHRRAVGHTRVDRIDRVRDAVGHRHQSLRAERLVLHEAGDDLPRGNVLIPVRLDLGQALPPLLLHRRLELCKHSRREDGRDGHI
mmetsp:Transcript_16750/g.28498  ORF Transcript_16750/g.28498 Transcript_16750/m.28498 type:complete len:224 (+) Transcript_16750:937-1608(+)